MTGTSSGSPRADWIARTAGAGSEAVSRRPRGTGAGRDRRGVDQARPVCPPRAPADEHRERSGEEGVAGKVEGVRERREGVRVHDVAEVRPQRVAARPEELARGDEEPRERPGGPV